MSVNPCAGWADAWAGLRAAPARAILAFTSLAAGLFVVTLLLALLSGLHRQARELTATFGADTFALLPDGPSVPADGSPASGFGAAPRWEIHHVETLRLWLRDRAWVSGAREIPPVASAPDLSLLAIDDQWPLARGWHELRGRPIDAVDILHAASVIVTSAARAQTLKIDGADASRLSIDGHSLALIGEYDGPADAPLCIPNTLTAFETTPDSPHRDVHQIWFRARPGHTPEEIRQFLTPRLPQLGWTASRWLTPETLLTHIRRWQRTLAWGAGSGALLSLLLGGTSLAGLLLTGVRERISEIGLRRALGARRSEIAALFIREALLLTLAAALFGMGAALLLFHLAGDFLPLPWHLSPALILVPFITALLVAMASAASPALLAARLPPAEALRND